MFLFLLLIVCSRNIHNHQISLEIIRIARCERSVTLITIGGKNGLVCNLLLAKCLVSTQQCFVNDWVNVTEEVVLDRTNQESLLFLFFFLVENHKHFSSSRVKQNAHSLSSLTYTPVNTFVNCVSSKKHCYEVRCEKVFNIIIPILRQSRWFQMWRRQ